ncbi:type IV pilus biogenesis/stability protein PilW [Pokkaliibacter sp. MBI-7]|uniref:type IV pilus biogenesis/stability protein PilW n=1 Tax=Pokkaliibacter sp. MBI-7 TaxID=3040600 RepID=UPI00244B88A5|nr:type IV pilus biogenesis/stability protein PilW [Pokkaliibacter sp. MBI-7]MDH2432850.1 type IV pilus biogenesis/stability protein PilW [Pokkaliibacter sp. MBI-7]
MRHTAWIGLLTMCLLQGCATTSNPPKPSAKEQREQAVRAAQAYVRLGLGYLQAGRPESAIKPLQRAKELDPNDVEVLNAWAMMYAAQGEQGLAEQTFDQAIARYPADARLHNNYGAYLFSVGKAQQGCAQVKLAAEDPLYTQRAQAFENLGRCALIQGDLAGARDNLNRAVKLSPMSPQTWYALAQVDMKLSDSKQAAIDFSFFNRLVKQGYAKHNPETLALGRRIAEQSGNKSLLEELNAWTQPVTPGASE